MALDVVEVHGVGNARLLVEVEHVDVQVRVAHDDLGIIGQAYAIKGVTSEESAAWTAAARIVLNMDEFITRE